MINHQYYLNVACFFFSSSFFLQLSPYAILFYYFLAVVFMANCESLLRTCRCDKFTFFLPPVHSIHNWSYISEMCAHIIWLCLPYLNFWSLKFIATPVGLHSTVLVSRSLAEFCTSIFSRLAILSSFQVAHLQRLRACSVDIMLVR